MLAGKMTVLKSNEYCEIINFIDIVNHLFSYSFPSNSTLFFSSLFYPSVSISFYLEIYFYICTHTFIHIYIVLLL